MTLSMYQASIPVFIHAFAQLSAILDKAEKHAIAKNIDPLVFTSARLAPDMFPLTRQIQIASDGVKGCAARLAGVENPNFQDTEVTFADLQARIKKTVDFIKTFTPDQIDGSEDKPIVVQGRSKERHFNGLDYLLYFVIPNFYFHYVTAYDILRHNGVEIGKPDFLGPVG